ncbi:hypothetical protein [Actinomyces sp. zg328]|uniref:hypothetical protein n=1 Tax=Actinomyces sp. zg328 TaxID=2609287 RepID=UPI001F435125|nr:hypothetical protein [Actinomyces sp. zg328]
MAYITDFKSKNLVTEIRQAVNHFSTASWPGLERTQTPWEHRRSLKSERKQRRWALQAQKQGVTRTDQAWESAS